MSTDLILSDKRFYYARSRYTLFMLLGDWGGFNAAIIMLPYYFMQFYSERMFKSSLTQGAAIRSAKQKSRRRIRHKNRANSSQSNNLQAQEVNQQLSQQEVGEIYEQVRSTETLKNYFWSTLFELTCLGKSSRKARVRAQVIKVQDKSLDIREIANLRTNLALLMPLLLSPKQRILFKYFSKRSFSSEVLQDQDSSNSSESDESDAMRLPKFDLTRQNRLEKDFASLIGHQVDTELDRKLLRGVLGSTYPLKSERNN